MTTGIGSELVTPKAAARKKVSVVSNDTLGLAKVITEAEKGTMAKFNIADIRWKQDTDITPPLLGYRIGTKMNYICRVQFMPHKLKQWKIEVQGMTPLLFSGTREDKQRMLGNAESILKTALLPTNKA